MPRLARPQRGGQRLRHHAARWRYGIAPVTNRVCLRLRLIGAIALLLCCPITQTAGATDYGRLKAYFLLHGQPHSVSLTISDGVYRKTFRDVTDIDELVPANATYSIEASVATDSLNAGSITFKDVIPNFRIAPGAVTGINVHLVPGAEAYSFTPVILIEDRLAQARVISSISRSPSDTSRFTLNSTITGSPGTHVALDTIVEPLSSNEGYLCAPPCKHLLPAGVDCSTHCYTCSTTAVLQGNVWKENFNMCSYTLDTGGSGGVASTFERFAAGTGGMVLNAALWNAAILKPTRTQLKSVATGKAWTLQPPYAARSFPDFVVPAGPYLYNFVPPEGAGPHTKRNLVLPIVVREREISSLYLDFPADDVKDFEPIVIADNRLGLVVSRLRYALNGRALTIEVSDGGFEHDTAWILVPLPTSVAGNRVVLTSSDRGRVTTLREGYDYTLNPKVDQLLVVLKVPAGGGLYTIMF